MRPLFHPQIADISVEQILYALSDPIRVQIFSQIAGSDCAKTCSNFLKIQGKQIPKSSLSQHFKILREAGLIRSQKCGVELHNSTRCSELKEQFGSLIEGILTAYQRQQSGKKSQRRKTS